MAEGGDEGDEHGADEVAEPDDDEVSKHAADRDAPCEDAHDHEAVSGEELAAGDEHHGETRREDGAADEAGGRARGRGGADAGGEPADGDEHAGEDRQHEHAPERETRLGLTGVEVICCYFLGCKHQNFPSMASLMTL